MANCLVCFEKLDDDNNYHQSCSERLFGTRTPPLLDFTLADVEVLAKREINQRISLTGVQPKLSLEITNRKGEQSRLTLVSLWGGFVFKPPSERFPHLPENEALCMELAEISNIRTAPHGLVRFSTGELAYLSRRFDRTMTGKLALEDLCQITETMTENKYYGSAEKVGRAIRRFATNSGFDLQRFFEQILFSFLIGNSDMHLKNYSLLTEENGDISLSPAYDILSTQIVLEDIEESALAINGRKSKLDLRSFLALANTLQIPELVAKRIVGRLLERSLNFHETISRSFLPLQLQTELWELIQQRVKKLS